MENQQPQEQNNVEQVEQQEAWHEPLNKVTPVSKYLAMALFVVLPFVGFWLGVGYGETHSTLQQQVDNDATMTDEETNTQESVTQGTQTAENDLNLTLYEDKAAPGVYTLSADTVYEEDEEIGALSNIMIRDVPNGIYVDEELGFQIRLPDVFDVYEVDKERFGYLHTTYRTVFKVDSTDVEWGDNSTFELFSIGMIPTAVWEDEEHTLAEDGTIIGDWNVSSMKYLGGNDKYTYTILRSNVTCPSNYRVIRNTGSLPTPHCMVNDAVYGEIADTFKAL